MCFHVHLRLVILLEKDSFTYGAAAQDKPVHSRERRVVVRFSGARGLVFDSQHFFTFFDADPE